MNALLIDNFILYTYIGSMIMKREYVLKQGQNVFLLLFFAVDHFLRPAVGEKKWSLNKEQTHENDPLYISPSPPAGGSHRTTLESRCYQSQDVSFS